MKTRLKSHNCGEMNLALENQEVVLSGWVSTVRDLGGILFIELRDRSGFFQIVANPQVNPDVHKVLEKVRSEYVITAKGKVTRRPEETYNEKYPTGQVEMYPESVEILSEAKVFGFLLEVGDLQILRTPQKNRDKKTFFLLGQNKHKNQKHHVC